MKPCDTCQRDEDNCSYNPCNGCGETNDDKCAKCFEKLIAKGFKCKGYQKMMCCKTCEVVPCVLSCAYRYLQCEGNKDNQCKTYGCQYYEHKKSFFQKIKDWFLRIFEREDEEVILCYKYDIAIFGGYPCDFCGCNPKSERYNEDECTGCGYCKHESCPEHGCIDCNEGKCEHEKNMGSGCPDNCPRKEKNHGA